MSYQDSSYYILGTFQPLTHEAIKIVRSKLFDPAATVRVYVKTPKRRSNASPFSFEEVQQMWEQAFDVSGKLEVINMNGHAPMGRKLAFDKNGTECELRSELVRHCRIWGNSDLPIRVARAIDGFEDDWKEHVQDGPSANMLS